MSAPLITKQQLAEHLAVHPSTIERWVAEGRIPSYRVGPQSLRFDLEEVLAVAVVRREAVKR